MAILKPFLGEEEIHKETKEPHHTCCDLCMSKCNRDNCYRDLFALEKMLKDTFCQNHIVMQLKSMRNRMNLTLSCHLTLNLNELFNYS